MMVITNDVPAKHNRVTVKFRSSLQVLTGKEISNYATKPGDRIDVLMNPVPCRDGQLLWL
jgi:hypothetical protein